MASADESTGMTKRSGIRTAGDRRHGNGPSAGAPAGELDRGDDPGPEVVSPRGESFQVVGRAGPVERRGAPPIPAEAREHLLVLKDGDVLLCTRTDGDIAPARASGEGFYAHDTRHLCELQLQVGDAQPVALSHTAFEDRVVLDATNAALRREGRKPVPQLSLSIARELTLAAGRLYHVVRVRNFLRERVTTSMSLALAADFADMFEVRGSPRRGARGHVLAPRLTERGLTLAYMGEDGAFRETVIEFAPSPDDVQAEADSSVARWELALEPGAAVEIVATAEPAIGGRRRPRRRVTTAIGELREAQTRWRSRCTAIESDDQRLNEVIARSVQDLRALVMPAPGGRIVAAGIPWYVAPFGRDALMAAGEALILNPDLAGDALAVLAKLQATGDDEWRDAEPGKILHELRVGELAGAGLIPHTPYYGTADATPLFLMRAADHYAWTGELSAMRALRPALDAALEWIDRYGDRDGDGFVEYERRSSGGLRNQGWKDSEDAIVHADGTLAEGPIALVEVQGYVYAAKRAIAEVYEALGHADVAARLREQAQTLRDAFNEAFWNAREGTYALALDGAKRQVASVTSNPGHCLYCGIADPAKASAVAERLMAGDMFCGWGVRTLSSECPAYNPMSYHNGSVWPHDNAIIAAGLKRYGHHEAALRIADCLFEVAAGAGDSRLPELYCGFDRSERSTVVAYPVACIPQAWAAASPFLILQALLGVSANAPARSLTIERPALPDRLAHVRLARLRVGEASVTLDFQREGQATGFTLAEQTGELDVTMAAGR